MKRQMVVNAAAWVIRAVLVVVAMLAFVVLVSTPGGMEDGVIGTGCGIVRMVLSFGVMLGAGRLADL